MCGCVCQDRHTHVAEHTTHTPLYSTTGSPGASKTPPDSLNTHAHTRAHTHDFGLDFYPSTTRTFSNPPPTHTAHTPPSRPQEECKNETTLVRGYRGKSFFCFVQLGRLGITLFRNDWNKRKLSRLKKEKGFLSQSPALLIEKYRVYGEEGGVEARGREGGRWRGRGEWEGRVGEWEAPVLDLTKL